MLLRHRWLVVRSKASLGALCALLAVSLPLVAEAQKAERLHFEKQIKSNVRYKARAVYDFSDDLVSGELMRPNGAFLMGKRNMRRANLLAARILERRLRKRRPSDLRLLREAAAADVVVVRGTFDRVQDVLRAVKVKHVVIPEHLLARVPLMSLQTVMLNCPGRLSTASRHALERFVKTGGSLVSTDWALSSVQQMFPGTIARGPRNTMNDVVQVELHGNHPLLAHVQANGQKPRWWLETASFPIRVLNERRVKVLVSSAEMKKKYGHGAVVVTFRYDDGKVLHMTSHFHLQQARLESSRERAKGKRFAKALGLDAKEIAALKKAGLGKSRVGELHSAYSMQRLTANVLADKARDNKVLIARFGLRARSAFRLASKPAASTSKTDPQLAKHWILRELERRGAWVRVRDLFGHEGWAPAAAVTARATPAKR